MCVFFFKQKTAYEMRISDWSSDVCSSDLGEGRRDQLGVLAGAALGHVRRVLPRFGRSRGVRGGRTGRAGLDAFGPVGLHLVRLAQFVLAGRVRSEGRRVGKESVSPCRSRWSP